ncbi:MAG: transcription termination/antitermination protein NusA [Chloroflexota bacterium]|nr:MAG: transcription termination/antitermination protein NusA [Chloroflexota bacterium]
MKNEFALAFNEVLEEKGLPKEVILEALEAAMVSAYRRAVNASNAQHVEAKIDPETGKVIIYAEKEVVDDVEDQRTEVAIAEAHQVEPEAEVGSMVIVETTPSNFGRVAAQTARQVIQQRIREAEREAQLEYFNNQLGEIVSGVVQAISSQAVTLGLDMKAEGIMPRNQQIPGERFRLHDRVRALLAEVKATPRGPQLILSRAHRNFLRRLLENEVPEIYHGLVEIRSIAREPGHRSKVAVSALQAGVDPVGACVGMRGVRIQAIVRELNDEKIDVIEWNPDPSGYIAKALSPARVTGVYLDEHSKGTKTATVVVPEDQLSLAIGRDGQNARLAAKLTAWRIDIKSLPEATADALYKIQTDPEFAELAEAEVEIVSQIEAILVKKDEGRPVTPEEYSILGQFVDRIERGIIAMHQAERAVELEQIAKVQEKIPAAAFEIPLEELGFTERVTNLLIETGHESVGDLMVQMELDSDAILALNGIGPKAMEKIENTLAEVTFPEPEIVEEAPEVEVAEEAETEPTAEGAEEVVEAEPAEEAVEEGETLEEPAAAELEPEVEAAEIAPAAEVKEPVQEGDAEEPAAEEEEVSFEEMFALEPETFEKQFAESEFEDEGELEEEARKKKKEKKKKYVEMEYDPDQDVVIVKRKRKRDEEDWQEDWDY